MSKKQQIPPPAHPHKRREALPWQQPKATEEDAEAMQRVQAILNGASYRRAENDSDFLARADVRGVRLQIDYLKPELLLEEHEIHQTIVVFGSTRVGDAELESEGKADKIEGKVQNVMGGLKDTLKGN